MPMLVIMNTVSTFIMFNISQKAIHIETKINFLISLKLKGSFFTPNRNSDLIYTVI